MWLHYMWYRIKIRYQINTVPTPTVAWTRAWLLQGGGGVQHSSKLVQKNKSYELSQPFKGRQRHCHLPLRVPQSKTTGTQHHRRSRYQPYTLANLDVIFFSPNRPALSSDKALGFTTRSLHQCCRAQYSHSIYHVAQKANLDLCLQSIPMHGSAAGTATPKRPK